MLHTASYVHVFTRLKNKVLIYFEFMVLWFYSPGRSVDGPCDLSHPPAHVAEEGLEGVSALLGDQGAAVEYQDLQLGTLGQQRLGTLDRGTERDEMLGTSIPESVMLTQPLTRISLSVLRHLLEDRVKRLRSEIFVLERDV